MNLIIDNMPKTMRLHDSGGPKAPRHHDVKARDNDRADIEQQILEFEAKGHAITYIPTGVGAIQRKTGRKLHQAINSGITIGNQARRAKSLSVKC